MKTVSIYRAQPIANEVAEQVAIEITDEIPSGDVDSTRKTFEEQGAALAAALWGSLPGGTLDELIANLLQRRASLFRVRFIRTASDA